MTSRPPGTIRLLAILARNSVLRFLRFQDVQQQQRRIKARRGRGPRRDRPAQRTRTARKKSLGVLGVLSILILPVFLFNALNLSRSGMQGLAVAVARSMPAGDVLWLDDDVYWDLRRNQLYGEAKLRTILERHGVKDTSRPPARSIVEHWREHGEHSFRYRSRRGPLLLDAFAWGSSEARELFLRSCAVLLAVLIVGLTCMSFGSAYATLAGGSWVPAWLATFPVQTGSLTLARGLEYALVQALPWFFIFPIAWQMARVAGIPLAFSTALACTVSVLFLVGGVRLFVETWLRMRFSLARLRTVQGIAVVISLICIGGVFSVVMPSGLPFWLVDIARATPTAVFTLPAVATFSPAQPIDALVGALGVITVFGLACFGTTRIARRGAMQSGGVDAVKSRGTARWKQNTKPLGILRKEWLGVLRDRQMMAQVLVVPPFLLAMNYFVTPSMAGKSVAAMAYGVGLYCSLGGSMQVLGSEGRALWLLYALPTTLRQVLARKLVAWSAFTTLFSLVPILMFELREGPRPVGALVSDCVFVAIGAVAAAYLMGSLSILGAEPMSDTVRRHPKMRFVYLMFGLASVYMFGLLQDAVHARLAAAVVFLTLVYAIWQRASERLDNLLDPVLVVRQGVTLLDGASALLVFALLQALSLLVLMKLDVGDGFARLGLAFLFSAAITTVLLLFVIARRGGSIMHIVGLALPSENTQKWVVMAAVVGVGLGFGASRTVSALQEFGPSTTLPGEGGLVLVLVAVLAAPIVEELLFRGVIYRGLARSMRPSRAAIWSALLFAVMHPLPSWPILFLVGIALAATYERSRWLPASMLLHAAYNATVLAMR
ncbi:MAG: CPBP family intramembrane metalloprotease [Planctomycetes bacterium]|nr:CPBP family intramembrane metalloprotease [Planctomycetota bacterium]